MAQSLSSAPSLALLLVWRAGTTGYVVSPHRSREWDRGGNDRSSRRIVGPGAMVAIAAVTVASCPCRLRSEGRSLGLMRLAAVRCCIIASAVSAAPLTAAGQWVMLPMSVGFDRCHTAQWLSAAPPPAAHSGELIRRS